jgi:hypothetical protein
MPQLDLFTFLPQIFWLILFFVIMYLSVVKIVIPNINRAFKLRQQTPSASESDILLFSDGVAVQPNTVYTSNPLSETENSKIMTFFKNLKLNLQTTQSIMHKKLDLNAGMQQLYLYYIRENARLVVTHGLKLNLYDRTMAGTTNLTIGYTAKLTRRFFNVLISATKRRSKPSVKKRKKK